MRSSAAIPAVDLRGAHIGTAALVLASSFVICAASGCASGAMPPAAPSAPEPAPAGPAPAATNPPQGQPAGIQSTYTGQPRPTLSISNLYPVTQYVFVDDAFIGTVATGATATFDVPVGEHRVTSADSNDPNDNPAQQARHFEVGYRYSYEVVGSGGQ